MNWSVACVPKEAKWNPQTVYECQFSLPYGVAIAAYTKKLLFDSYTPQAMAREDVRDLMTRISAKEDPNLPPWAARVNTTLRDGRNYSSEVLYVKGHPENPFTEQELVEKFKECVPYSAYKLSDGVVKSLIAVLINLEKVDDVVNKLILPLTPSKEAMD